MSKEKNDLPYAVTREVRDSCLCLHAQRAARALARRFDEAFRLLGLTNGQFSLLMALNRPEPPNMGQVSAVLAMDRTTLTANLKPLRRRGLVAVAVDAADRRGRRPALTPAGRELLVRAVPIWRRTHAAIERELGRPARESILGGLAVISGTDTATGVAGPSGGRAGGHGPG